MAVDVPAADMRELSARYHIHYEVRPYYVVWDQRPEGAPEIAQKIQAGYSVDLFATLNECKVPLFDTEDARAAVDYFVSLAQKVQATAGNSCTVEIIPENRSLVLDTSAHFQPEAMLEIRIRHQRGLDQPAGPSEETALKAIRGTLQELGIRES